MSRASGTEGKVWQLRNFPAKQTDGRVDRETASKEDFRGGRGTEGRERGGERVFRLKVL